MSFDCTHTRRLLVGNHFAKIGDVLFYSRDFFRPGVQALVRYSGSILSFGFGKGDECVLEFLLKRGAGHTRRVSLGRA
jgi:hypothetical protein